MTSPLDSPEFVTSLQDGATASQEALVRETIGRMIAVAQRLLGNRAEAEDVVQESYIAAFQHIADFDRRSSITTWLQRIVTNAALMRLRKRKVRAEVPLEALVPKFENGMHAEAPLPIPSPETSPETAVMLRRDIERALDSLPDQARAIIVLHDLEGLNSLEVAQKLELSHEAARQRLHRARQALMKQLSRDYVGGRV